MAAFDPVTNLRVGTMVLQECIARAGGNVELGLSCYVGAVTVDGSFYLERVLKVYERMQLILAPYKLPSYKQTLTLQNTPRSYGTSKGADGVLAISAELASVEAK